LVLKTQISKNYFKEENGVLIGSIGQINPDFELQYLKVRTSEKRVYSDEELIQLPYLRGHQHAHEWELRNKSAQRVLKYFASKSKEHLLDLGCGNGWFSQLLARNTAMEIIGMDVNKMELEQAARVFKQNNLKFVYGDVFKTFFPTALFNFITVNAAIQYFPDLSEILKRLLKLLKRDGEIHLIDSPFYNLKEIEAARKRTDEYYKQIGFPEMSVHYFHHSFQTLEKFGPEIMYNPSRSSRINKLLGKKDIPFPWIKIRKH